MNALEVGTAAYNKMTYYLNLAIPASSIYFRYLFHSQTASSSSSIDESFSVILIFHIENMRIKVSNQIEKDEAPRATEWCAPDDCV